jgi:hypothetical protein
MSGRKGKGEASGTVKEVIQSGVFGAGRLRDDTDLGNDWRPQGIRPDEVSISSTSSYFGGNSRSSTSGVSVGSIFSKQGGLRAGTASSSRSARTEDIDVRVMGGSGRSAWTGSSTSFRSAGSAGPAGSAGSAGSGFGGGGGGAGFRNPMDYIAEDERMRDRAMRDENIRKGIGMKEQLLGMRDPTTLPIIPPEFFQARGQRIWNALVDRQNRQQEIDDASAAAFLRAVNKSRNGEMELREKLSPFPKPWIPLALGSDRKQLPNA